VERLREDAPVVLGKELPDPVFKDVDTDDATPDAIWPLSEKIGVMWIGESVEGPPAVAVALQHEGRNLLIPCPIHSARKLALALLAATLYDPKGS
jgi:hypothetical protein